METERKEAIPELYPTCACHEMGYFSGEADKGKWRGGDLCSLVQTRMKRKHSFKSGDWSALELARRTHHNYRLINS